MDINRYNTRVRQAVSGKYIECSKRLQEVGKQMHDTEVRLNRYLNSDEQLTYREYIDLKSSIGRLRNEKIELSIALDVWNEAREICLDIADEMDTD